MFGLTIKKDNIKFLSLILKIHKYAHYLENNYLIIQLHTSKIINLILHLIYENYIL